MPREPKRSETVRLDGRVAVVTGAGRGLGRSHALQLAERGAQVVVNDPGVSVDGLGSDDGPAQDVVDEIVSSGGSATPNTSSVATPTGAAEIMQTAIDAFGQIDIVVNNAGILSQYAFEDLPHEVVERMIGIHLMGTINVSREAWPRMKRNGYGRIVNTSSNSGWIGTPLQSHYGAAKMGILGLTRCLALEGEPFNIRVNAIAPGAASRLAEIVDPALAAGFAAIIGDEGHRVTPEIVSPLVTLLSSEACPTTGELFSTLMGRVSRIFIGMTDGFFAPDMTPESLLENFEAVFDEANYTVPKTIADELTQVVSRIRRS